MPVLYDHAAVSEWALEATAWIKNTQLIIRESSEREMADSTGVIDSLFNEVYDDAGVPTTLALFLAAVNERDRVPTAYDLKHALFLADKHDLCEIVEWWLVGDKARRDEEEKQRYRKYAARILENERTMWLCEQKLGWKSKNPRPGARPDVLEITPERVERLAAKLRREARRSSEKSSKEEEARRTLDVDMRAAAELPLEPPVVLERKALNQLDKRAKARKLAGPTEAIDDENEHRQHREKQEQQELRNAQTKARNQKRAKARAHKLAA